MQTVKIIKGDNIGDILTVENNDAFSMVDKGVAELYKPSVKTRVKKPMTPKKYKTK